MEMALRGRIRSAETEVTHSGGLYKIGGAAALVIVLTGVLDIVIMFLPGTAVTSGALTAVEWFRSFQGSPFLGLRNLGLLNMVTMSAMVPVFLALYAAHRRRNGTHAALAAILLCMGATIYIANNRALPMLALGGQYAAAATESQRSLLAAAGQAMLAQEDLTPGAFPGFLFAEVAGMLMACVMLRGEVFSRSAGYLGLLGEASLLLFNLWAAFVPAMFEAATLFGAVAGLLSMAWLILTARGLFRLAQQSPAEL